MSGYCISIKNICVLLLSLVVPSLALVQAYELSELLAHDMPEDVAAIPTPQFNSMEMIDDDGMKDVTGRALFELSQRTGNDGMQFLRFLFNATVDVNANIEKIQLGIYDLNGDSVLDLDNGDVPYIDLDKVSISGSGSGPDDPATLTRPFLELALANFNSAQNKQLVGIRAGAESATGELNIGDIDSTTGEHTGINYLHGYVNLDTLTIQGNIEDFDLTGHLNSRTSVLYPNAFVEVANYDRASHLDPAQNRLQTFNTPDPNSPRPWSDGGGSVVAGQPDQTIEGVGVVNCGGFDGRCDWHWVAAKLPELGALPVSVTTGNADYGIILNEDIPLLTENGPISSLQYTTPTGRYILNPITAVETPLEVFDSSSAIARLGSNLNLLNLTFAATGTVTVDIDEPLRYFHVLPLSGNSYLSFQSQDIRWPNTQVTAKTGVWLGIEDLVSVDTVTLPDLIVLDDFVYRQIEVAIEKNLSWDRTDPDLDPDEGGPLKLGLSGAGTTDLGTIDIGEILSQQSDLNLGDTQIPSNNCYGGIDCF